MKWVDTLQIIPNKMLTNKIWYKKSLLDILEVVSNF
jgi:hypothetical protein